MVFEQPPPGNRDWYTFEAIRSIPKIIQMIDRNIYSETYGCFDREFWHYKVSDFPCGMSQEFCLPLALVYEHNYPQNPFYKKERLKELVNASINFSISSSHTDGSCDDYFPYEKALGAAVFSGYAMSESYIVLSLNDKKFIDFFERRADWLINNNETGQLSNHQALAALFLYNVFLLTNKKKYKLASDFHKEILFSWQDSNEGWYQEYEGADPGYHTFTISSLAKLYKKSKDNRILDSLHKAVDFAYYFMHPDGSYGGEYGSRNTYHFYPYGFEFLAKINDKANHICKMHLTKSLPNRKRYFNEDDRMFVHYVYDWLQSWLENKSTNKAFSSESKFFKYMPNCNLLINKNQKMYSVLALNKGGVTKVFNEDKCIYSDTGPILLDSQSRVYVSHIIDSENKIFLDKKNRYVRIVGYFHQRKTRVSSPIKQILFRLFNLSVGKINPHLVRSMLQSLLITGKNRVPIIFDRTIIIGSDKIKIITKIINKSSDIKINQVKISSDSTSIYVAQSNVYQDSVLLPWRECNKAPYELLNDGYTIIETVIKPE